MMLHFSHQSDLEKILSKTTDKTIQLPRRKHPNGEFLQAQKKQL